MGCEKRVGEEAIVESGKLYLTRLYTYVNGSVCHTDDEVAAMRSSLRPKDLVCLSTYSALV